MGKETGKQSNILFQGALLHNAENGKSLMFPEEGAKFIKINCFFCFFFCSLKIIHKRVSPKILYAVRKQTQKIQFIDLWFLLLSVKMKEKNAQSC